MADLNQPSSGLRRRRSSSAASSSSTGLLQTAKDIEHKIAAKLLVLWDDLPTWRRDNHFIVSGYRPDSNSYRRSLASLFYVHNEFVNIWTHLLGALTFPIVGAWLYHVIAPRYASANANDILVFSCFFAGAVLCLSMSAMFHAISNHSEEVSKWGNKLDYSGIVFLIVGSFVPALYYGLFCAPNLTTIYLYGISFLGLGCGVVSWVEQFRTPRWRPYRAAMFVGLGVSGIVPVCHGLSIYGYEILEQRMGLNWVLFQGFLYILGAFLYAVRWPERSFPKTFDIWGSSHQIFHVLILFAAGCHLVGMSKAFDYHHTVMEGQC
ncbi:HlyIII-domain-containing protein [Hypoxylon fragiforme]|uniref:HlyIII-domain-containing protein n=1 Tax=Hypoxylon fragiforme TaxID=63214 RepID=UPI0020C70B44|nr:HlyIII-domain-containing protein [Hypoxylon fragiforme]KAI2614437.1 HlyIII-domain-containing protein [Hypoxylon fragiforme]